MGGKLTKLAIWGDAILLLLLLAGLEDRRKIERTTPNFGLEETVGARPCVRGQRVAGVQMDGEHLLGQEATTEVGVLLAWAWLWKKREEEHRQGGRWTAATAIEKRRSRWPASSPCRRPAVSQDRRPSPRCSMYANSSGVQLM